MVELAVEEFGFDVSPQPKQHDPKVALWFQLDQTLTLIWSLLSTMLFVSFCSA